MAQRFVVDEKWLATARGPQLVALAGAVPGAEETIGQGKPLEKLTGKQLRERILAAAKDGRLDGHVLPEAQFGTKAELERACTP